MSARAILRSFGSARSCSTWTRAIGDPIYGMRIPMLGLGTAGNGAGNTDGSLERLVAAAALPPHNIELFDTAQNYGSEAALGQGLANSGVARASLFLSCKVDLDSTEDPGERVRRQVASSLRNLQTEYLDSVIIHWPIFLDRHDGDHALARKEAWRALEGLVRAGTVRCIGVSNWTADLLDELLTLAAVRPALNQVEFSPAVHQRELHAFGTAEGIATVGYERCASFTTRISLHQPTPTHRYSHYGMCWMALHEAEASGVTYGVTDLTQHAEVAAVAAEAGCTAAQALLRWSLQHGVVCIPKTAREGRLQEALGALHVELSGAQMGRLDTLSAIGRGLRGTEASIRNHLTLLETKLDPQFVRTSIDVR